MDNNIIENLHEFILDGEDEMAEKVAADALKDGIEPAKILNTVSAAGDVLGDRYETGDIYLPELFAGAEAMTAAVEMVLPTFERLGGKHKGIIVIGTVEGDVHDIGKRIVSATLIGSGFKVHDLGVNVKAQEFVEKAQEMNSNIIAASALLTTTCQRLPEIAEALKAKDLQSKVKFMIGGAAVSRDMVEWAGADGYGDSAVEAVAVARKLMDDTGSET